MNLQDVIIKAVTKGVFISIVEKNRGVKVNVEKMDHQNEKLVKNSCILTTEELKGDDTLAFHLDKLILKLK